MRINLFSANATVLTLHGEMRTQEDIVSVWRGIGLPYDESLGGKDRHIEILSCIAGYHIRGQVHQILFALSRHEHDDSDNHPWYLQLDYTCPASEGRTLRNPPREARENTRKLIALFSESALSGVEADFHFDSRYRFAAASVETIISVPFIKFNDASLPFTSITEVRLSKETENDTDYDVTLSAVRSGTIDIRVSFHMNEPLNTQLPGNLLKRANNIMSKFITKKDSVQ